MSKKRFIFKVRNMIDDIIKWYYYVYIDFYNKNQIR